MTKRLIRVLVVDDSAFMRKIITDLLSTEPQVQVIGHARNGEQALELIKEHNPDIVTLDIEMPVMDGLSTLEAIMRERPLPVIMLSSLTETGSTQTIKALELGAVDFIQKPTLSFMITSSQFKDDLLEKVKASVAYRIKQMDTTHKTTVTRGEKPLAKERPVPMPVSSGKKIVAIAVSTGGPKALQSVIPMLPANLSAAVLVVQHMPAGFTKSLAERLNQLSAIDVKEAEHGELMREGQVYIAPGDYHLRIAHHRNQSYVELSKDAPVGGHRPAADQLFESLSRLPFSEAVCVVMTGMGSDGTKGIEKLNKTRTTYVIAQNEDSCVVYGMPKSVTTAGLVDKVAPLNQIANVIINRIGGK